MSIAINNIKLNFDNYKLYENWVYFQYFSTKKKKL